MRYFKKPPTKVRSARAGPRLQIMAAGPSKDKTNMSKSLTLPLRKFGRTMETALITTSETPSLTSPRTKRKISDVDYSDEEEFEDDNSTESNDEDGNVLQVPPYDAASEKMPRCSIYHPKFLIAQALVTKIFELIQKPLDDSLYTDDNVVALNDELKRCSKARSPRGTRIALVGDMGTGKSSMLNSLLSVGVLARKGDMGASCTWVVQEFSSMLQRQSRPYGAEIEYYKKRERVSILADLFRDAYDYSTTTTSTKELVEDQERKMIGQSALKALHALLRDHDSCSTEEDLVDLISSAESDTDDRWLDFFRKKADEMLDADIRASCKVFVEADTPEDLLAQLREYTANAADADEQEDKVPSHWPLIKTIRYGLSTPITDQGIVLLDVPGTRDVNRIRHKTVSRALATCTHYLVLANIARAQDDETMLKYLAQGFHRLGSGRAVAVCTHTDRVEETSGIPKSGPRTKPYKKVAKEIELLEDRETKLKKKQKMKTTRSEKLSTLEEFFDVQSKITVKKAEEESLRISERSNQVANSLRATYKGLTGDPDSLAVFSISNSAYEQHRLGIPNPENRPSLTPSATEIPALRQHLYAAIAKGHFNVTSFHMERNIPSLLASVELWCAKAHMKRRQEIEKIVMRPIELHRQELTDMLRTLQDLVRTKILDPMKRKEGDWCWRSDRVRKSWDKHHATTDTYRTLLRANGFRRKWGRRPGVNWNGELVAIMAPDVKQSFGNLADTCVHQELFLTENLGKLLDTMENAIKVDSHWQPMALSPFIKKIAAEKATMQVVVENAFKNLKMRIALLEDQVINNCDDSIVAECMEGIYAEVLDIKGNHCGTKRRDAMRIKIATVGTLWSKVHGVITARLLEMLTDVYERLEKRVGEVFASIYADFNHLCQTQPYETYEETRLRVHLSANLSKAKRILDGELKEALNQCKQWV